MNINLKGTNVSLSKSISDYVDKRLAKMGKILGRDESVQCDVELARTTGHHQKGEIFRAEVHIVGKGRNIYASAEREDMYSAIDGVRDEVMRELQSGKAKRLSFVRRGGARVKAMVKGLWPWGKTGV